MDYFKGALSVLSALILAEIIPGVWSFFRHASGTKATGLAVLWAGLLESVFSPLFWILAISFFALFFSASRCGNKPVRTVLFWIPTLTITAITIVVAALLTALILYSRR